MLQFNLRSILEIHCSENRIISHKFTKKLQLSESTNFCLPQSQPATLIRAYIIKALIILFILVCHLIHRFPPKTNAFYMHFFVQL